MNHDPFRNYDAWKEYDPDMDREDEYDGPWIQFTRRTNEPKLSWLEMKLEEAEIPHRRNGESFHAPILEVADSSLEKAWKILDPVDNIPDDDPQWMEEIHEI